MYSLSILCNKNSKLFVQIVINKKNKKNKLFTRITSLMDQPAMKASLNWIFKYIDMSNWRGYLKAKADLYTFAKCPTKTSWNHWYLIRNINSMMACWCVSAILLSMRQWTVCLLDQYIRCKLHSSTQYELNLVLSAVSKIS